MFPFVENCISSHFFCPSPQGHPLFPWMISQASSVRTMPLSIVASANFNFMSTPLRFVPKPFLKIKRPVFKMESWRSLLLTPPQPTQPLPPLLKPDSTHFSTPLLIPILTNNSLHGLHRIVHSSPNRWNLLHFLRVENQLSYQKVITLVWQDLSLENPCHILSHFSLDNMSLISLWLRKNSWRPCTNSLEFSSDDFSSFSNVGHYYY